MDEIKELKRFPFFKNFTEDDLKELTEIAFLLVLKKGEILFKENSPGKDIYLILEGEADVLKRGYKTVKEYLIATVSEGSIIGEIAWFLNKNRSATIRAKTNMKVFRIDGDILRKKCEEKDVGVFKFLFELLKLEIFRLSQMNEEITKLLERKEKPELSDMEKLKETISKTIAF